mmetsp:Transcript_1912/g.3172  ORF Transcript_1912/g.3172 Transcript_1912/m.3172 type:complete len:125 (-) Transcript_1912:440-814(-)
MESRVRACFTPTTVSYERARGGCLLFPDALNTTGACDNAKRASATSSASGWRRDNEALAARSGNSGTCVVVSLSVSAPIAVVSPLHALGSRQDFQRTKKRKLSDGWKTERHTSHNATTTPIGVT